MNVPKAISLDECSKLMERVDQQDWKNPTDFGATEGDARQVEGERRQDVWKTFLARTDASEPLGMIALEHDQMAMAQLQTLGYYLFVPDNIGFRKPTYTGKDPRFYIGVPGGPFDHYPATQIYLNPLQLSPAPELTAAQATYTAVIYRYFYDPIVMREVKRHLSSGLLDAIRNDITDYDWHGPRGWPYLWYVPFNNSKTIIEYYEDDVEKFLALSLADIYGRLGALGFYRRQTRPYLQSNYWDRWSEEYDHPTTFLSFFARRLEKETGLPKTVMMRLLTELAASPLSEAWELPPLLSDQEQKVEAFRMSLRGSFHRWFNFNLVRWDDKRLWIKDFSLKENSNTIPNASRNESLHYINVFSNPEKQSVTVSLKDGKVDSIQFTTHTFYYSLQITIKNLFYHSKLKAFLGDVEAKSINGANDSNFIGGAEISLEIFEALLEHGRRTNLPSGN